MLSSASHAHFVEVTVGGNDASGCCLCPFMGELFFVQQSHWWYINQWFTVGICAAGICAAGLTVSGLAVQSATLTSIPVISSNILSWTVFLIPCLISWISTLSVLAIRSAKTLEMIAFSVLVKDRFVEASSLARSHC